MKSPRWVLPLVGALSLAWCAVALAQNQRQENQNSSANQQQEQATVGQIHGYLGIGLEPLHSSLVNHLANLIGGEYGLLVDEVVAGSPAANAGVRPNDVIYRYDEQKLFSPEQFVRLVHGDKPGHEATLSVIRSGKPQTIQVTLGEQQVLTAARPRLAFRRPLSERPMRPLSVEEREAAWSMFDSMNLTRVNENHFKAQIQYRDDQGKIETRNFEGTRDEISKAIEGQKDMPADERNHLLRAIDLPQGLFGVDIRESDFNRPDR